MTTRLIRVAASVVVLTAAWAAVVLAAAHQGWFRAPLAPRHDAQAFMAAARHRVGGVGIGNCAIALIENGRVVETFTHSIGHAVDARTLFQAASISKWVTAWGVMALVERGTLELDAPVSKYLTRWRLPPSEFANDGVTVRRLLSHTAGLGDGLGYRGFPPGSTPQRIEDSLTFATDHMPGADGRTAVRHAPGSRWQYSGGGFTLLQLLVEEVTHDTFGRHMERIVFAPLGMRDTTFDHDTASAGLIATFYDAGLKPAVHYRYTALAAASLYTTPADLATFVLAHMPGPNGEPPGRDVLRPETLTKLRIPQARAYGRPIWGLGPALYGADAAGGYVFGHDGANYPAINHAVRIDAATRNAIVVLSTGSTAFAMRLATDWVFWETGHVDLAGLTVQLNRLLLVIAAGAGVILAGGGGWLWLRRSRERVTRTSADASP